MIQLLQEILYEKFSLKAIIVFSWRRGKDDFFMCNSNNVLVDICGVQEVDWRGKKKDTREFSEICRLLAKYNQGEKAKEWQKRYERSKDCGSFLLFGKKKGASDLSKKLILANFCKDRFCPMCMWRRSIKFGYQLKKTLERSLKLYPNSKFLFLTLTEKNIEGTELKEAIKDINASYSRMFHYKRLSDDNVILGTIRATECTFNKKRGNFNLHIHVLIQVDVSYFDTDKNYYVNQEEWQALWKKAAKLDYDPIIDIRTIHPNKKNGKDSLSAAVAEVAKYEVKSFEFININNIKLSMWLLDTYSKAFKGTRKLGLSGILRKIKLELFASNNEDELVHIDESSVSELSDGEIVFIQYEWNYQIGDYLEVKPSQDLIEYVLSRRRRCA